MDQLDSVCITVSYFYRRFLTWRLKFLCFGWGILISHTYLGFLCDRRADWEPTWSNKVCCCHFQKGGNESSIFAWNIDKLLHFKEPKPVKKEPYGQSAKWSVLCSSAGKSSIDKSPSLNELSVGIDSFALNESSALIKSSTLTRYCRVSPCNTRDSHRKSKVSLMKSKVWNYNLSDFSHWLRIRRVCIILDCM